ncbi:MAG: MBL fold metallo-hydrolase [bacterium]|nr:MBL fold metallo-hydrolase [bacterium]
MRRISARRNRARASVLAAAALLLLLVLALPAFGQGAEEVQIKTLEIADGIFMLEGQGGNIGVAAGPDGVFMIDDQFAPLTEKIKAAIAEVSDQPIRFLINTHWHFDHTGGNENLGKAGVVIVAHHNVRERMSAGGLIEFFDNQIPPAPGVALPVITFEDSVTFHLNGDEIHVFHVPPAHTDGDSVIHFKKANVVHTGDLYFNGLYPFIDTSSGASVDGVIAAAERIHAMIDEKTRIIPGHGAPSNRAELAEYIEMLKGVRASVGKLVEAGKTLEETQAAKPTAPWDEPWGKTFITGEQFTAIVYGNLAGK